MRLLIVALIMGLLLIVQPSSQVAQASPLAAVPGASALVGLPEAPENRVTDIAPSNWVSQRTGITLMSDDAMDFNLLGHDVLKAAAVWDRYVPHGRQQADRFWNAKLMLVQPVTPSGTPLSWQPFTQAKMQSGAGAFGGFDEDGIKLQLYGAEIVVNLPDGRPGQYSWASVEQAKKDDERTSVALIMDPKTGEKKFTEYRQPKYEHAVSKLWNMDIQHRMLDFVNEFGRFPKSLEELGLVQGVAFRASDMSIPADWDSLDSDSDPAFFLLLSPQDGFLDMVVTYPGAPAKLAVRTHRLQYEHLPNGRVQPIMGQQMGRVEPLDPSFCVRAWRVPTAP